MGWLTDFFSNISEEGINTIVSGIISVIIAVIGWIITIKMVSKQIDKQHKANIELDKNRIRKELEIKCAEEGIKVILDTERKIQEFAFYLKQLPSTLRSSYEFLDGYPDSNLFDVIVKNKWDNAVEKSLNYSQNMSDATTAFFYYFDAHYIILWDFVIMKDEIFKLNDKLRNKISDATRKVSEIYHFNYKNSVRLEPQPLSEFEELVKEIHSECYDLIAYFYDFVTSLQNVFLSSIFDDRLIPERKPTDFNSIVLYPTESRK